MAKKIPSEKWTCPECGKVMPARGKGGHLFSVHLIKTKVAEPVRTYIKATDNSEVKKHEGTQLKLDIEKQMLNDVNENNNLELLKEIQSLKNEFNALKLSKDNQNNENDNSELLKEIQSLKQDLKHIKSAQDKQVLGGVKTSDNLELMNELDKLKQELKQVKLTQEKQVLSGIKTSNNLKNKSRLLEMKEKLSKLDIDKNIPPANAKTSIEFKYIRLYIQLNNQTVSKTQIEDLLKKLQDLIKKLEIRKDSKYAKEINEIQDNLVKVYNKMGKSIKINIELKKLNYLKSILSQ